MRKQVALTKICICLLAVAIILSASTGVKQTGAWFTDTGTWLEAEYGVGVIDYTVHINGESIEKIKNGQEVALTIPIVGAAKLSDGEKPVGAVRSSITGQTVNAHDEFDEAVTLIRAKIVNTGGLPVGIRATVSSPDMADSGMLYMVLPYGTIPEPGDFCVSDASGSVKNYRSFITGNLSGDFGDFAVLAESVKAYHSSINSSGVTNDTVIYPGKLPSQKAAEPEMPFEINVLCWAEFSEMPWNGQAARDNTKTVDQINGKLIFTINCIL